MTFLAAITSCFEKYARFRGRASRSEFWYFTLFYWLGMALVIAFEIQDERLAIARIVFSLGTFLPLLAVTVRRLHDVDRSGWWYFIVLVPFGAVVLLVWYCRRGTDGPNRFGDPHHPHQPHHGSPADDGPAPAWTESAAARIASMAAQQAAPATAQASPQRMSPQRMSTGPREFGRRQYKR